MLKEELKVGDMVKIVKARKEKLIGLEDEIFRLDKNGLVVEIDGLNCICFEYDDVEKVDYKPQAEPFELKVGMKFKTLNKDTWLTEIRDKIFTVKEKITDYVNNRIVFYPEELTSFFFVEDIDWKETRSLNEYYGLKADSIFIDEGIENESCRCVIKELDTKKEVESILKVKEEIEKIKNKSFFMVWRNQGSSPTKKHETYEQALKEAERLVKNNPNIKFYVLESKAEVKANVEIKVSEL